MPEAGAHSPYTEKRKHNRFAMEAALHYFDPSGNAAVNGRLRDISACGMGFISPHPLIPESTWNYSCICLTAKRSFTRNSGSAGPAPRIPGNTASECN
jgi:hypothetical protein